MTELLLQCRIAGRPAAFLACDVQSVIAIEEITPIPGTPDFILGLTALRSQALTVIDCARAIGMEYSGSADEMRAAVVEIDGHPYAFLVDAAYDVGDALGEPIAVPGGFGGDWQRVARGLVETENGPTLLLDTSALIAAPRQEAA